LEEDLRRGEERREHGKSLEGREEYSIRYNKNNICV